MSEYLELVEGRIRCSRCGHDICDGRENYKLWVLQDRGGVEVVPLAGCASHDVEERLELRRYYCPGCCTQLDAEVSLPEIPPLHDIELDIA